MSVIRPNDAAKVQTYFEITKPLLRKFRKKRQLPRGGWRNYTFEECPQHHKIYLEVYHYGAGLVVLSHHK